MTIGKSIELGNSARYVDNGGNKCLVWLAGLHEPYINSNFIPESYNLLNLKDVKFDWYTGGAVGLAENFEELVIYVKKFLQGQKIVCGGQSSGGYGALRLAHALNADLCIVFAPQTKNITQSGGGIMPFIEVPSVEDIYLANPPSFPVLIHVSRSEKESLTNGYWNDHHHIALIKCLPNITIITHPYDIHAVSIELHKKGLFYNSILWGMQYYL